MPRRVGSDSAPKAVSSWVKPLIGNEQGVGLDLAAEWKAAAAARRTPLAQFIRETMKEKLSQIKSGDARDPLAWMDGLAESGETDLASRVDEILYHDGRVH